MEGFGAPAVPVSQPATEIMPLIDRTSIGDRRAATGNAPGNHCAMAPFKGQGRHGVPGESFGCPLAIVDRAL
jgi:hypothetical protein